MKKHLFHAVWVITCLLMAAPSHACVDFRGFDINDVKYADTVVIGRARNYEIILDQQARKERQQWLDRDIQMSAESRKQLAEQDSFMSDYARFDFYVDEEITGKVQKKIKMVWQNSTYGEPDSLPNQRLLIAGNRTPKHAFHGMTDDESSLTVLTMPCSSAFILQPSDKVVSAVRRVLDGEKGVKNPTNVFPADHNKPLLKQIEESLMPILIVLGTFVLLGFSGLRLKRNKRR